MPTNNQSEDQRPVLYLFTPCNPCVRPYFERFMPEFRISDSHLGADAALMISSAAIYDVSEGCGFNELTPLRDSSEFARHEHDFRERCLQCGLTPTVLRCAPIVCTGMTGWVRDLAGKIARGTFIALAGNEARRSVVHAVSLPDAARAVIGCDDTFNVTDTVDPLLSDLADALAWRIAQKRIFSIPARWYRILFGKKKLADIGRSLTFSCEKLRSSGLYNPVSVVDYLKTHVYDESSL